jgi:hypothetical protein
MNDEINDFLIENFLTFFGLMRSFYISKLTSEKWLQLIQKYSDKNESLSRISMSLMILIKIIPDKFKTDEFIKKSIEINGELIHYFKH